MTTQLAAGIALALSLVSAAAGYHLGKGQKAPAPEAKVIYQDKVQYVDRVLEKNVIQTVTKPGGVKIVTETREKEVKMESLATRETTTTATKPLPKYALGLSVGRELGRELLLGSNIYQVDGGYRLTERLWVTGSLNTNKDAIIGLRLEF